MRGTLVALLCTQYSTVMSVPQVKCKPYEERSQVSELGTTTEHATTGDTLSPFLYSEEGGLWVFGAEFFDCFKMFDSFNHCSFLLWNNFCLMNMMVMTKRQYSV